MSFAPSRTRLLVVHALLSAVLTAIAAVCAFRLLFHTPDLLAAAALPGLVGAALTLPLLGQRILMLARARYEITSAGMLRITLGGSQELLPLEDIQEIRSGNGIPPELRKTAPGWKAGWQGRTISAQEIPVDWFATTRGEKMLLIVLRDRILAISPDRPVPFANLVAELSTHGSLEKNEAASIRPGPLVADILANRVAVFFLITGLILMTGLGSLLLALIPSLPPDQFLKFDPAGVPSGAGDPERLLILPLSGGVVWLMNTLLGWRAWRKEERPAALTLWGFSFLIGVGLWAATGFLLGTG
jgi:hypothetical protein